MQRIVRIIQISSCNSDCNVQPLYYSHLKNKICFIWAVLIKRFLRFSLEGPAASYTLGSAQRHTAAFPFQTTIPPTISDSKLCFLKFQTGDNLLSKVFTKYSYYNLYGLGLGAVSVITNTVRQSCSLIKNRGACFMGDQIANGSRKQVFRAGKPKKQNPSHPTWW